MALRNDYLKDPQLQWLESQLPAQSAAQNTQLQQLRTLASLQDKFLDHEEGQKDPYAAVEEQKDQVKSKFKTPKTTFS